MKQPRIPRYYANSKMSEMIDEFIHSERDRGILKRRLLDGITLEQIAAEFEMSRSQIIRIIEKHERMLFKMMFDKTE